jgi:hypothetical protein
MFKTLLSKLNKLTFERPIMHENRLNKLGKLLIFSQKSNRKKSNKTSFK